MRISVPALVQHRIAEAEVAPDVNDRAAVPEPAGCLLRGLAGWKRCEDDLRVANLQPDNEGIGRAVKVRLNGAERLALMRPGDHGDKPRLRVPQHQTRELATCVASNSNYRCLRRHSQIMRETG